MTMLRSLLFTPGNHDRRMQKTLEVDTDAVILDLEDAVADAEKPAARETVRAYLARPRGRRRAYVRVNGLRTPWSFADFDGIVVSGLDGVVLPKAESATDLAIADYLLSAHEAARGLPTGAIEVLPIIETAKGVEAMREIARATPRVRRMCFGSGDFTNDTGTPWSRDNPLLLQARAQLAITSRAAGIEPPLDTVWAKLDDEVGLIAEADEARRMGYQGKMAIHPKQLPVLHRVFSPSSEEIERARTICAAFEAAEARGSAAIVVDGVFVDYPVVYKARRVLEAAEQMSAETSVRSREG
jgi:citrate lyase subunit beta / citryl-CoA lyase